jgi:hypothetical protein
MTTVTKDGKRELVTTLDPEPDAVSVGYARELEIVGGGTVGVSEDSKIELSTLSVVEVDEEG